MRAFVYERIIFVHEGWRQHIETTRALSHTLLNAHTNPLFLALSLSLSTTQPPNPPSYTSHMPSEPPHIFLWIIWQPHARALNTSARALVCACVTLHICTSLKCIYTYIIVCVDYIMRKCILCHTIDVHYLYNYTGVRMLWQRTFHITILHLPHPFNSKLQSPLLPTNPPTLPCPKMHNTLFEILAGLLE